MHPLIRRLLHDAKYNESLLRLYHILKHLECAFDRYFHKEEKHERKNVLNLLNFYRFGEANPVEIKKIAQRLPGIETYGKYTPEECALRSIVLKNPVRERNLTVEKGVLLLKFTNCFEYFLKKLDTERLLNDYYLVLEPSWSGYCDPRIIEWMNYPQHKIIVQSSEIDDYKFLEKLDSNLMPVSFGAGDWVDHRLFYPIETDKKYDAVYVAVYAPYKRHHALLKAVRKIKDKNPRIALVGVPWLGTKDEINSLINHYGLDSNVDIFEKLNPEQLNIVLNQSKVNVLLSLREGSNKSIFEGFFSNVPGIVLKKNKGLQKEYINFSTGCLIEEEDLPDALLHFRDNRHQYAPREWALKNISPLVTTDKLNGILKSIAQTAGERWTHDIVPKVNSPELEYFHPEDRDKMVNMNHLFRTYSKERNFADQKKHFGKS